MLRHIQNILCALLESRPECSIQMTIHHTGIDIAFPANGRRIAKPCRHGFYRLDNLLFCFRFRVITAEGTQRDGSQLRGSPGTKILGGNVFASNGLKILIHVL